MSLCKPTRASDLKYVPELQEKVEIREIAYEQVTWKQTSQNLFFTILSKVTLKALKGPGNLKKSLKSRENTGNLGDAITAKSCLIPRWSNTIFFFPFFGGVLSALFLFLGLWAGLVACRYMLTSLSVLRPGDRPFLLLCIYIPAPFTEYMTGWRGKFFLLLSRPDRESNSRHIELTQFFFRAPFPLDQLSSPMVKHY